MIMILCFTLLSLSVAILSWANAPYAFILRNRARSNYINTTYYVLDNKFHSPTDTVLTDVVNGAIVSTLFTIYGVVTMHPRWKYGFLPALAFPLLIQAAQMPYQVRYCGCDRPMGLIWLLSLSLLSSFLLFFLREPSITFHRYVWDLRKRYGSCTLIGDAVSVVPVSL
jgi:hypothetical protein